MLEQNRHLDAVAAQGVRSEQSPKRILITGISGFVGRYLARYCRQRYPEAALFGLYHQAMPLEQAQQQRDITVLNADITRASDVQRTLAEAQPEIIFHLAAQSSVAVSWSEPALTLRVNALGAINLLEAARLQHPSTRIVLVGSGEQYGAVQPADNPIQEDYTLRPINPYAVAKTAQDLYGYQYFSAYGLPVVRVRTFNHFGPYQSDTFVIASFARQIARIELGKAEPVILVGNLQAQRDFLPVEDIVAAYIAVAEQGRAGEVYNVGSGQARTVGEMLDHLLSCARTPIQVRVDPERMRPLDIPILAADITRIQVQTTWRPVMPIASALDATLEYWREVEEGHKE